MEKSKEKRRYLMDDIFEAVDIRNSNSAVLSDLIKQSENGHILRVF
jgi:hypothetical protein